MSGLIALDEARRLLLDGQAALEIEIVPLAEAAGRVLAEELVAVRSQPPAPLSAMDGYAVQNADVAAGARLHLIGEAPAGAPFAGAVGAGECVRIATGGVVPHGADRVIVQEHVERDGDAIVVCDASGPMFVRPAGCDFAEGDVLLPRGTFLGAARLGLVAASGRARVSIFRRPRVAILASGDELIEPGDQAGPGAMFNSAAYALAVLVERWGGLAVRQAILPDDLDVCIERIGALSEVDLIVPLGGASVGDRDVMRAAFEALSASLRFERIAVVPGKPSWHARFGDGRIVLGLPGNPSSAFVCAHLLLKPLLFALTGRDPAVAVRLSAARLTDNVGANGAREAYLRGTTSIDGEGQMTAKIDPRQDSGLQTPLAAANALIRRPPGAPAARAGDRIDFLPI
ncbi:MAG: molybdopterin molybdotransferase MoeA [Sphingomonas sp.]|uniref:molybdopterin molybdotransferase MoeA n=1 Tax=Sphingomonas sp. TaxID=28214 RepID=UPI001823E6F4|nr:molybdopterin molybdotransferase MoeA [Sphingomonas sp.]MBA3666712.1 molybdopterin molybdotransferase MoeA [Sphingomonas sp.]